MNEIKKFFSTAFMVISTLCSACLLFLVIGLLAKPADKNSRYTNAIKVARTASKIVDSTYDQDKIAVGTYEIDDLDVYFEEAIVAEPIEDGALRVTTVDVSEEYEFVDEGLFNWRCTRKSQLVTFHGTGYYMIDFSDFTTDSVVVDSSSHTVTITVPAPKLEMILNVDETEFYDSTRGWLTFTNINISPEELTQAEVDVIDIMTRTVNADHSNYDTALENASHMLTSLYQPIIDSVIEAQYEDAVNKKNSLDPMPYVSGYEVVIVFEGGF